MRHLLILVLLASCVRISGEDINAIHTTRVPSVFTGSWVIIGQFDADKGALAMTTGIPYSLRIGVTQVTLRDEERKIDQLFEVTSADLIDSDDHFTQLVISTEHGRFEMAATDHSTLIVKQYDDAGKDLGTSVYVSIFWLMQFGDDKKTSLEEKAALCDHLGSYIKH